MKISALLFILNMYVQMMEKWVSMGSGHKKERAQQAAPELKTAEPRAETESWKRGISCQTWGRNMTRREPAHTCERGCSADPSWGPAQPSTSSCSCLPAPRSSVTAALSCWAHAYCRPCANGGASAAAALQREEKAKWWIFALLILPSVGWTSIVWLRINWW